MDEVIKDAGVVNIDELIREVYGVDEYATLQLPPDPMLFGFYVAKGFEDSNINMPARQTEMSAGYDLECAEDVVIPPMLAMQQEIVEIDEQDLEDLAANGEEYVPVVVQQIFLADNRPTLVKTGLKCRVPEGMVLKLFPRSSLAYKKNLTVANNVGIIDADYFENESNDGHIMVAVLNRGTKPVEIKKGERIAQAILEQFYVFPREETPVAARVGGFGSTEDK